MNYYLAIDIGASSGRHILGSLEKEELEQEEQKNYFDRLTQEFSDETKKEHILRSIGILPSKWENIQSTYQINDLTKKYNVSIGQ